MKQVNINRRLLSAIDQLLSEAPAGLTEYDLIKLLDERYHELYPKPDLSDSLILFQHHFYLRHSLYTLQNEYADSKLATLEISAVNIRKSIHIPATHSTRLDTHDPLKTYYLNLENLNKESKESIQTLLGDFWLALGRYEEQPEALSILGLSGNETEQEKKKRYRELAQKHHPDKGGDAAQFDKIQQAWLAIKK